jgi:Cu/Ag efflux pump CusA
MMTVVAIMAGLLPILWSEGTGPREQPHIDRTLSATPEQLASICTSSIIKMQTVVIDHTGAEPIRPQVLRSP